MPHELSIRPATHSDSHAIAELYGAVRAASVPAMPAAVHSDQENRAWFSARLSEGKHDGWVAELDGRLVGFALATTTWLDGLYVDTTAQHEGIGSTLLEAVKGARVGGFGLWVFESNAPARAFYRKHGLVELERTDGSGNEEKAPDVKMVWPGADPLACVRSMIDEVDLLLGDVLARRTALTRVVQGIKADTTRDSAREADIVARVAAVAPELGLDRVARIVDVIIAESIDAAES